MTQFDSLTRPPGLTADVRGRPDYLPRTMVRGLEPIADALVHSGDVEACAVEVGRELAAEGVALNQVLDDLETTYAAVAAGSPGYLVVRALCLAWTEVSLQYLHGLSCHDPLTGLASLPHLRSRIDELFRTAERDRRTGPEAYALVVVELGPPVRPLRICRSAGDGQHSASSLRLSTVLALVEVTEAMRDVFSGGETFARICGRRACALVSRDAALGAALESLRQLLEDRSALRYHRAGPRVWIESLPATSELTSALLDELAR